MKKKMSNAQMNAASNRRSKAENDAAKEAAGNFSVAGWPASVYPVVTTPQPTPSTVRPLSGKPWTPRRSR